MLVRFTVDPDIFTSSGFAIEDRYKHLSLLDLWSKSGVLVIPTSSERSSSIYSSLLNSPPGIQSRWAKALKHFRKATLKTNREDLIVDTGRPEASDLKELKVNVLSLESTRAELWGIASDEFTSPVDEKVEFCRFGHEQRTRSFAKVLEIRDTPISSGMTFDQFWGSRLSDLAEASKHIVISDRYLAQAAAYPNGVPVLSNLISRILRLSGSTKRIVEIYTAIESTSDITIELIKKAVYGALTGNPGQTGIFEVRINACSAYEFGRIEHYRFLLFDQLDLVLLDKGLTGFREFKGQIVADQTLPVQFKNWLSDSCIEYRKDLLKIKNLVEKDLVIPIY